MLRDERLELRKRQDSKGGFARVEAVAGKPMNGLQIIRRLNPLEVCLGDRAKRQGLIGTVLGQGEKQLACVIEEEVRVGGIFQLPSQQRKNVLGIGFSGVPKPVQLIRFCIDLRVVELMRLEAVKSDHLGMELRRGNGSRYARLG